MVRTADQIATAHDAVARMFADHGPVLVTVERMTRRNISQNALMWAVVSQIALAAGVDKADMHEHLLVARYGFRQVAFGGAMIPQRPKSSAFSKSQMADYISWMLEWAADRGVKIVMPDYWGGDY